MFKGSTQVIKLSSGQCSNEKMKWCIDSDYISSDGRVLDKKNCKTRPCVISNCESGHMFIQRQKRCVRMDRETIDFTEHLPLYKILMPGVTMKTDKKFNETFQIVTYQNRTTDITNDCTNPYFSIGAVNATFDGYFLDDGSFFLKPNTTIPREEYIVMFTFFKDKVDGLLKPRIKIKFAKDKEPSPFERSIEKVFIYAMLVSVFFMILVIVVYTLCKELRTNAGLNFMTYVSTLATAFFLITVRSFAMELSIMGVVGCYIISPSIHLFTFSSFMWMNIMGFDIWWTLRNMFYRRRLDHMKSVNYRKYKWHCTIAFGPPLVYVIIEICIDELAEFEGPMFNICTACNNGWYLLGPKLALQTINFIPFGLLIFNLLRLQNSNMKQLNSIDSNNTSTKQNALLCIKISVMLGTNWFMDIMLSFFYNELPAWFKYTVKAYNSLFGLILFLVYIFKADVLLKLFKRLSINNKITEDLEMRVSRKYSNSRKFGQTDSNSSTVWQMK
ncbi:G-protein coupled receptor Mth2-like isoform X2 [Plodia interpunctella]|uniref:G-protein coupled receptor Mth2-like isoform X2 n=1 Tax=Plodia interpunctella TaxID=58824 RepID=UPI002368844F|nr:G-protein coupled receptor Mth2-like isoform X2 [Plodia interpunctella]